MINYYFFQFIKKKKCVRTGPWTVPSRGGPAPPGANSGTCSVFSNLDGLGPARVDRAGPWTVRNREPYGTVDRPSLDRTGPDRTVFNALNVTLLQFVILDIFKCHWVALNPSNHNIVPSRTIT
jgi:hypothetical protein